MSGHVLFWMSLVNLISVQHSEDLHRVSATAEQNGTQHVDD